MYFVVVIMGTFLMQIFLSHYFHDIIRTSDMSRAEWSGCIVIGASPIAISIFIKLTPKSWIEKLPVEKIVNENKDDSNNMVVKRYS